MVLLLLLPPRICLVVELLVKRYLLRDEKKSRKLKKHFMTKENINNESYTTMSMSDWGNLSRSL